jgi:hypothetical protein
MKSPTGLLFLAATSVLGQGNFQNLDFESANIQPGQGPGLVSAADAIPGWTPYLGTNEGSAVLFDNLFIGQAVIALIGGPGWTNGGIVSGIYTAVLQAGSGADGFSPVDAAISQTGLVPMGTHSIQFLSSGARNGFTVTIAGQPISLSVVGTQNGFNLYRGDVSQFSGLSEELRITALSVPSSPANLYIDSILFSAEAVPEPGFLGLFSVGAVAPFWRFVQLRQNAIAT